MKIKHKNVKRTIRYCVDCKIYHILEKHVSFKMISLTINLIDWNVSPTINPFLWTVLNDDPTL